MRAERKVPPSPGCRPSCTSGKPKDAPSTRSGCRRPGPSRNPPPRAAPCTTQIVGHVSAASRSSTSCPCPADQRLRRSVGHIVEAGDIRPCGKPALLGRADDKRPWACPFSARPRCAVQIRGSRFARSTLVPRALAVQHQPQNAVLVPSACASCPRAGPRRPAQAWSRPEISVHDPVITPPPATWHRPGRRRYIRWRCRALPPVSSSRSPDAARSGCRWCPPDAQAMIAPPSTFSRSRSIRPKAAS